MDRRTAGFIDRGEIGLDDMGDDIAGMNADPDPQRRIVQELDAVNQFDGRMTGHDGMIVIRVRRTKKRDQAVAAFLADDAAVAANRDAHGGQGWLEPRNRCLRIQFRDQVGGTLQVGAEDGEVLPLAGDATADFRGLRPWSVLRDRRPAGRAIQITCLQGRETDLTKHPRLLHPPLQINERSRQNKRLQPTIVRTWEVSHRRIRGRERLDDNFRRQHTRWGWPPTAIAPWRGCRRERFGTTRSIRWRYPSL